MEVRATKAGFYEVLRQPGDVFHVPDGLRASWFVPVGLNPFGDDNHAPEDGLGAEGLNPNDAGVNPEVNPENTEKNPENGNIFPEKTGEIPGNPENPVTTPETGKPRRK